MIVYGRQAVREALRGPRKIERVWASRTASEGVDAIAATVIGGTSLMGGEGNLGGTLVGARIMGVLRNGLNLLGVSSFLQQVVIGAVIVVAVLLDTVLKRKHRS